LNILFVKLFLQFLLSNFFSLSYKQYQSMLPNVGLFGLVLILLFCY